MFRNLKIVKSKYLAIQGIQIIPTFVVSKHDILYRMNTDNTKSQMRKGMLEYCIMLLLRRQPCYANDIIQRLLEAEMIVMEGTLYPLLSRLKRDGLLGYEWRESTQGPPRKYYVLTEEGQEALAQLDANWEEILRTVNILKLEK